MEFINIDGRSYFEKTYRNFYASNLSEHGLIVFNFYSNEILSKIEEYLAERRDCLGYIQTFVLNTYNCLTKTFHSSLLLINRGNFSPFGFFNEMKIMCNKLIINTDFYACDFNSDSIFKTNVYSINKIGSLNVFSKILGLDENNKIVLQYIKFCSPKGYGYFSSPKVFRNEAEKDFYVYLEKVGEKCFDKYYSLEECKDKIDMAENCLKFEKNVILDFDIDDPNLSISGKVIKARRLNVKSIYCYNELFCDNLVCQDAQCTYIFTESVMAESIGAEMVKTNYKYGLKKLMVGN